MEENAKYKEAKEGMEKKLQKLTNENADLINRIIVMKQEVVNKMNEANELYDEALNFRKVSGDINEVDFARCVLRK